MNINKIEQYGHWKDGGVLLEGQAIEALCCVFDDVECEGEVFRKCP